jgi:hypothetical protein
MCLQSSEQSIRDGLESGDLSIDRGELAFGL